MQRLATYNKSINRISEPVAPFAYAKHPPEPLTSYAGRYMSANQYFHKRTL